jgi:hypothetical protein
VFLFFSKGVRPRCSSPPSQARHRRAGGVGPQEFAPPPPPPPNPSSHHPHTPLPPQARERRARVVGPQGGARPAVRDRLGARRGQVALQASAERGQGRLDPSPKPRGLTPEGVVAKPRFRRPGAQGGAVNRRPSRRARPGGVWGGKGVGGRDLVANSRFRRACRGVVRPSP